MQSASQSAEEQQETVEATEACAALLLQAHVAFEKFRVQSAVEYLERALALADATQPGESLVVASVLNALSSALVRSYGDASVRGGPAAQRAAWREEPRAFDMSRRCLQLLLARYDAGTLSHLTLDETNFYKRFRQADELTVDDEKWLGCSALVSAASLAISGWPTFEAHSMPGRKWSMSLIYAARFNGAKIPNQHQALGDVSAMERIAVNVVSENGPEWAAAALEATVQSSKSPAEYVAKHEAKYGSARSVVPSPLPFPSAQLQLRSADPVALLAAAPALAVERVARESHVPKPMVRLARQAVQLFVRATGHVA
jgi:hypothetical protein